MLKRQTKIRIFATFIFFFVISILLAGRLFYLQVLKSQFLGNLALAQHQSTQIIKSRRGTIYDAGHRVLAVSVKSESIYAQPQLIANQEEVAGILAPIIGLDEEEILKSLRKESRFSWIARCVDHNVAREIRTLKLIGIGINYENRRLYPHDLLAAHILGFAGIDNRGLEGLELAFNSYLTGADGWRLSEKDGFRRRIFLWQNQVNPALNGYNLTLTINSVIQNIVEVKLDEGIKKYNAKAGSIIVVEPKTGRILAAASRPSFDPNYFAESDQDYRRNRIITDYYEPGSSFKIIAASAVLNEDLVKEEDEFYCEKGLYFYNGHQLHDFRPYENLTFSEVVEKSSNIGICKVGQLLGDELFYEYIRRFGFGELTGVDLPGEIPGYIRPPKEWSKISITALPMGQEIGVTALQMAMAISVIANGGELMRPFVVSEIRDEKGELINSFPPQIRRKVIKPETARRMREILTRVVENGTGKKAAIWGVKVAGKTGTSQKLEPDGTYSHSRFIASFIGFLPADDPQLAIVVVFDEPTPVYYGGSVSAPVFRKVASEVMRYLKI